MYLLKSEEKVFSSNLICWLFVEPGCGNQIIGSFPRPKQQHVECYINRYTRNLSLHFEGL